MIKLGKPTTVGELKKILEQYPDDTSFGFRNQPMQCLFQDEAFVVFDLCFEIGEKSYYIDINPDAETFFCYKEDIGKDTCKKQCHTCKISYIGKLNPADASRPFAIESRPVTLPDGKQDIEYKCQSCGSWELDVDIDGFCMPCNHLA